MSRSKTAAPNAKDLPGAWRSLDDFFDLTSIEEARELLWAWLKTTVAGNYNTSLDATERALILDFYENMAKMLEAGFILQQQRRSK